jgi:hypothetical protein
MKNQKMTITTIWILVSALSILLFTGCEPDRPVHPPVTPKVERKLVSQDLMQGLPVDNRVIDPEYYLASGNTSWFLEKLDGNFTPCESFRRVSLKAQPVGRNALKIDGAQLNPSGCAAWGAIKVGVLPVNLSVWAGSANDDFEQQLMVQSHFYDPTKSHYNQVQALQRIANSRQIIEGITWYQYQGNIPDGAIGIADIMVEYSGSDSILIAGAIASDVESKARLYYSRAIAKPATESMRKRLEWRKEQQENQMF